LAALALAACGDDDDGVVLEPGSGEPEAIRGLDVGELAFAARPATCTSTRAVVLAGGDPRPSRLIVREGGCFLYANRLPDTTIATRRTGPARDASGLRLPNVFFEVPSRYTSPVFGPLVVSRRTEIAERAEGSRTELLAGAHNSTAAFGPSRPPGTPVRCNTRALRVPHGNSRLRIPYATRPGGGRGAVVLDRRSAISRPAPRPVPRELADAAELDCGARTLAELPAGCETTRAVTVVAGRPRPARLRMPRARACVVWANADDSEATLRFRRSRTIEVARVQRRLWPTSAAAWDFFFRSQPGSISYTIEPGGARGTIELE
jgi:hypothetical protein